MALVIETNTPKDLGCPFTDFQRLVEIIQPKLDSFLFQ